MYEPHENAQLSTMESDTDLIDITAYVAEPVASVVLPHGADQRAAHFVQFLVLGKASSESLHCVFGMLGCTVLSHCHSDQILTDAHWKLEPLSVRCVIRCLLLLDLLVWAASMIFELQFVVFVEAR